MRSKGPVYWFDHWVEQLCIQIADAIKPHLIGSHRVEKIQLWIPDNSLWPQGFKLFMTDHLVATSANHDRIPSDPNIIPIHWQSKAPTHLPFLKQSEDLVANYFIDSINKLDPNFYLEAWTLNNEATLPGLLYRFALKSMTNVLPEVLREKQIRHIELPEVTLFDDEHFMVLYPPTLEQLLKQQIKMYFSVEKVMDLTAELCFARKENRDWMKRLWREVGQL